MKRRSFTKRLPAVCLLLFTLLAEKAFCEDIAISQLKAAFAIKILKFTTFPDDKSRELIFATIGSDKVSRQLHMLDGQMINQRKLKVIDSEKLTRQAHAYYISRFNDAPSQQRLHLFRSNDYLTFTDNSRYYTQGCGIFLKLVGKKIRFLVNPNTIDKKPHIPSRVYRLALNRDELARAIKNRQKKRKK